MARNQVYGRLRYDKEKDTFIYEVSSDADPRWGLCMSCKCMRREGAEPDEGADYIHFSMLQTIVRDVRDIGAKLLPYRED